MTGWVPPGATPDSGPNQLPPGQYPPGQVPPAQPPPAYPIAGYPGQPYAPAYPSPPPAYPGGMYPGAPFPPGYGWTPVDPQPGTVLGAAVTAYVNSGLLILSGTLLMFGSAVIHDVNQSTNGHSNFGVELGFDGLLNLIAGALLIAGAVTLTNRRATGRVMLTIGAGIVLAECLYWSARFSSVEFDGRVVYVVLFGALAVISVALAWTPAVTAWLRHTAAPRHT